MSRCVRLRVAPVVVCGALAVAALGAQEVTKPRPGPEAAAAAKSSPALVEALSKEIDATPEQAAGAAGALFSVAKSRLAPDEFAQVAKAVPGMDALLKAAPTAGAAAAGAGALSKLSGPGTGLGPAVSAFSKLGLKPEMVGKAVTLLTSFVTKSGGTKVGSLLAGALK